MNAKKQPETESFDAAELGAMMREMRENLGHDLDAVARDLRIRLVYLEAIESGRLTDLPGNAYVSGFLRSYSDFLGLEGEEIVRRFKMAGAEISSQPQLHLPSPVEEGRLPTGSILLVAAVIAAAAYGGWYYLSGTGNGTMETVASLPKELSGLVDDATNQTAPAEVATTPALPEATSDTGGSASRTADSTSDTAPAAAPVESENPSAPAPAETAAATVSAAQPAEAPQTQVASTAENSAATTSASPASPATSATESTTSEVSTTAPAVPEQTAAVTADPAPAPTTTPAPAPTAAPTAAETPAVAAESPASTVPPADAPAAPVVSQASDNTPAPAAPSAAAPAAPTVSTPPADTAVQTAVASPASRPDPAPSAITDPAPTVTASRPSSDSSSPPSSANPDGTVRIVVRATADSYVAVRTGDNQPLFSQLMRRGDSYEVPSGADLILETGNAGGLQITVGGKRVPSLGPIGQIRRNIPLDAEKLLSGIN